MKQKLSKSMSFEQFDNGYWYVDQLKAFAKNIGIGPVSKLRKDELEKAIKAFLKQGKIKKHPERGAVNGQKDSEKGLHKKLLVKIYTNNKETKNFIVTEAKKDRS